MKRDHGNFLGLDFGTSTTLLARSRGGSDAEILPLGRSTAWIPSVVGIHAEGQGLMVGEQAELLSPLQSVRSIKNAITFNEQERNLELASGSVKLSADELIALIIREALERANWDEIKPSIAGVRAGCPAMWDREQRLRLIRILSEVGVDVPLDDLIDEPIAAAIAWVNHRRLLLGKREEGRLVVFDYGGGTLDIAVCEVQWANDQPEITVLSCLGIPQAGDILDKSLFEFITAQLRADSRYEGNPQQDAAVLREVRLAKEALSSSLHTTLQLEPFGLRPLQLSRAELESQFRPQLEGAKSVTLGALKAARLRDKHTLTTIDIQKLNNDSLTQSVDLVLLAGGMSQIPAVADTMQKLFPEARIERIDSSILGGIRSPQHLIAAGLVQDPDTYDRLNLHRPGFNLRIEWKTSDNQWAGSNLYSAYTPLYSSAEVQSGNFHLGHTGAFTLPSDVKGREGRLTVTTESGERMSLRIDGNVSDGLDLPLLAKSEVSVKLYVDGRLVVRVDGQEPIFSASRGGLRVERWQVLRDPASNSRVVELSSYSTPDWGQWLYPHK